MNWLIYCVLTIVFYGIHDVILKHLSVNTNAVLSSIIINGTASIGILLVFVFDMLINKSKIVLNTNMGNMIWLVVGGLSLGFATITFMKAFSMGANFSIVLPLVYVGIIVLSSILGYFFFMENISLKQFSGIVLSVVGMYLLIQK